MRQTIRYASPPGSRPASGGPRWSDSGSLECYFNGVLEFHSVPEAHRKIWEVDFAWVLPTDWHRFAWAGFKDEGLVRPKTADCGREFGIRLLTRTTPLSYSAMEQLVEGWDEDTDPNVLIARASRFNRLFPKKLRQTAPLYFHYPIPNETCILEHAYRLAPSRTTLLISRASEDGDEHGIPWPTFETPPLGSANGAARTTV